jgi:uncharacterized protein with HEPN domain
MSDASRLADILERIDRIRRATRDGQPAFTSSEVVQDAVIRNLEVIGETAKHVSVRTRRRTTKVPWSEMARFRDLATHHNGQGLAEEVWTTVAKDLPVIRRAISSLISKEPR